jgi:cytochrome P450
MSWAFFHLLMKKDLVSKIREQTTAVLGADRVNQQQVTYDNYKRFVWARAVLLEALRLHPSVPKVSEEPTCSPDHLSLFPPWAYKDFTY